ncbi:MAG: hypothetical protein NC238_00715, partial [Dehalobacter sp.]|nr:hypothetical protein [Dehalobacter sp.]
KKRILDRADLHSSIRQEQATSYKCAIPHFTIPTIQLGQIHKSGPTQAMNMAGPSAIRLLTTP